MSDIKLLQHRMAHKKNQHNFVFLITPKRGERKFIVFVRLKRASTFLLKLVIRIGVQTETFVFCFDKVFSKLTVLILCKRKTP